MLSFVIENKAQILISYFPKEAEEGIFLLKYSNVVRTNINVVIYKNDLYIPTTTFLTALGIDNRLENGGKSISGFFIKEDSVYHISIAEGKAIFNGIVTPISSDKYFLTDLEIFIRPEILSQIFGISIKPVFADLEVRVESKVDLPLLEQAKRNKNYKNMAFSTNNAFNFGPLLFDRNRSLLNGGMLDYNINATQSLNPRNRHYSYNLNSGIEILGGDLISSVRGSYDERSKLYLNSYNYKWRYFISENPYLSQFSAGQVSTGGSLGSSLPATSLTGVQISNDPAMRNQYFSTIVIEDKINPEWQVELWINNQLYGQKQSDMTGYYRFDLPINFGITNIELRYYGPKGEVISKKDFLNIPSGFLRPGEVRYAITGGKKFNSDEYLTTARLSAGITGFLSNSVLVTKMIGSDSISFVNNLALRIYQGITTTFDISPNSSYRATLSMNTESFGGLNFSFTQFDGVLAKSLKNQAMLSFGLPRLSFLPFGTSFQLSRNQRTTINEYNLIANLNTSFMSFYFNALLRATYFENDGHFNSNFQTVKLDLSHSVYSLAGIWEFLNRSRVGLSSIYDLSNHRFQNLEFFADKSVGSSANVRLGLNYNFVFDRPNVFVGVNLNLPTLRSSSTAFFDGERGSISQNIQSTLAFDSYQNELFLKTGSMLSSTGMGALSVRFFLDENEDGEYTDGETLIPDVTFNVRNTSISRSSENTLSRVHNLVPYGQYNLVVNMESFKNPLWTPTSTEFSFIADPNSYKPIDVPCYSAGIIEGGVMRDNGKEKRGQAGIKLHVMKMDSSWKQEVPVFADGNFYFMGVPPGDYVITIDSIQMVVLNVHSDPKSIPFTIKKTSTGDLISNLNFILLNNVPGLAPDKQNDSKKVISASTSKPDQTSLDKAENYLAKLISKDSNSIAENDISKNEVVKSEATDVISKDDGTVKMQNSFNYKTSKMTYLTLPMQKELDKVAAYLQKNSIAKLQIDGHSDNFGSPEENMAVSNTRTSEVVNYLSRKGIKKDRLLSAGHGALLPISDNMSSTGRAKNRRVDLKVIEK
jgi:outer membrane protein OmpA-like peptidoglycan-associated protein